MDSGECMSNNATLMTHEEGSHESSVTHYDRMRSRKGERHKLHMKWQELTLGPICMTDLTRCVV